MSKIVDRLFFVKNQLGSILRVVNLGDVVRQELQNNLFGVVQSDSNPGFQPFGIAGGHYDWETGLVRFGASDYDAEMGRWLERDPILFNGGDANLYVYCNNDPVNCIDPSGLIDGKAVFGGVLLVALGSGAIIGSGGLAIPAVVSAAGLIIGTGGVITGGALLLDGLYDDTPKINLDIDSSYTPDPFAPIAAVNPCPLR